MKRLLLIVGVVALALLPGCAQIAQDFWKWVFPNFPPIL